MSKQTILVIDDEPDIRSLVQEILEDEGFSVETAGVADQANALFKRLQPDLVLLDIWMPGTDGISLLQTWQTEEKLDMPVIMMSGHGTVETAVEATRLGAFDFIEKPVSSVKLLSKIKQALTAFNSQKTNVISSTIRREEVIGQSSEVQSVLKQLRQGADSDVPVLIFGASGTGKENYAYYLHRHSNRRDAPFLSVNISGLDSATAETKLFSWDNTQGYLHRLEAGTLFIMDIADLDQNLQVRLQREIEHRQANSKVRLVVGTRVDLRGRVASGLFREDLFYQLNVLLIKLPELCQHYEDVPELLDYYVDFLMETEGLPYRHFSVAAKNRLRGYPWTGDVRELKNLVQRLLILGGDEQIKVDEIDTFLADSVSSLRILVDVDLPLRDARENFEKAYLLFQLEKAQWNVSKVANVVGIERTHLYRKLRSLEIDLK